MKSGIFRTLIYLFLVAAPMTICGAQDAYSFVELTTSDGLSQMSVLSIFQDSRGYMWFGTRNGLNRYDGYSFSHWLSDEDDPTSISDNYVKCISEDSEGNLWIGTRIGLNRMSVKDGTFCRYMINDREQFGESNTIRAVYADHENGNIYVGGFSGLYVLEKDMHDLRHVGQIDIKVNDIRCSGDSLYVGTASGLYVIDKDNHHISWLSPFGTDGGRPVGVDVIMPDKAGHLWMSSFSKGVMCVDSRTWECIDHLEMPSDMAGVDNEVRALAYDESSDIILGTNVGLMRYDREERLLSSFGQRYSNCSVESLYMDMAGSLWIGTYSDGAGYTHPYMNRFSHHDFPSDNPSIGISGPMVMNHGNLYMGTEGGGLISWNPKTDTYTSYPCVPSSRNTFRENNVKSVMSDGHLVYVGLYSGWVYVFDVRKGRYVEKYHLANSSPVYAIIKDGGKVLLGTYSHYGVKELVPGKGIRNYAFTGKSSPDIVQVSCMLRSGKNLYIGTRANGLYRHDGTLIHHYNLDDKGRPSGKMISVLMEDSVGNLFVGTYDGGLSILPAGHSEFIKVTRKDGLNDDMVCSVVEDRNSDIWVVTRGGISRLDEEFKVMKTYGHSNGIGIQEFSIASAFVSDDNTIYVGGNNGFVSFRPDGLDINDYIPPVLIQSVLVNNEPVGIDGTDNLVLDHDCNNITFVYTALNYIYPEQNGYACMLEGAGDAAWTYMGGSRGINYANLSPGKYVFRVKGSNNDGVWNEEGVSVNVVIKPPFYLTGWAFAFYLIILAMIVSFIIHYSKIRQNLEQQMIIKQHEKRFYQARIDLFTNFSHELRTPLTLIQGPIEEVVQSNDPSKMDMDSFRMVYSNLNRLLLLVDQIMTFRKKETGALKINVSVGDFVGFAREIRIAFSELARLHDIDFRLEEGQVPADIWYDRALFERVLMNLLSNAFKYTPDGGIVKMSLDSVPHEWVNGVASYRKILFDDRAAEYLRIQVEDSGPGIPDKDLEKIFDPFYQVSDEKGGTGLGLTLSYEIVRLHHGAIWADNRQDGGSVFTVLIPVGNSHFSEEEIIRDYQDSENVRRYEKADNGVTSVLNPRPDCTVLIVEDNNELREYMISRLSPYFKVLQASNGREGIITARAALPAIVVSDIMMPVMDGLQLCRELKTDPKTNHIPVILLTARSMAIQMREGLELGADDYITKPFSMNTLALKISNMISSRENLRSLYAKDLTLENMGVDVVSSDDRFLQKLNEVVANNITDPNLDVGEFCSLLGMSRSSLYRKLQVSTGMSPSKYIQSVRLHLAAKMFQETDHSVQEVMDAVGFVNPAHFSTLFKKQYGISPSMYRRKK